MTVRSEDQWFIDAISRIKTADNLSTDTNLSVWLQCPKNLIAQIRSGNTRPPFRLKLKVAERLGFMNDLDGIAFLLSEGLGKDEGDTLRKAIQYIISTPDLH